MSKTAKSSTSTRHSPSPSTSKLDLLLAALSRPEGATINELAIAVGWQTHSVRGAMAGSLKRKGYVIASTKDGGVRRYQLIDPA